MTSTLSAASATPPTARAWTWCYRHRWNITGAVLAVLAVCGYIVWQVPSVLRSGDRAPTPEGGEISSLELVCHGAVEESYCAKPSVLAKELETHPLAIVESHITATGASRPSRVLLRVDRSNGSSVRYRVKWRQVPNSLDEPNNSPRREIAGYAIQQLLFAEERAVVVPTVLRCLPLKYLEALEGGSAFPGSKCALGLMSHWIEDAREFDMGLIETARPTLAQRIGDLNVFGYVSAHRDAIGANFLMIGKPPVRVFAIDSGMTFDAWEYNPLGIVGAAWMSWKATSIHPTTRAKLEALKREDLDVLRTVAELHLDAKGIYRAQKLSPPWPDAATAPPGVRRRDGAIQLGLTEEELDHAYERSRELLEEIQ